MEPLEVDPALLAELADADSPQGVLAVAHLPHSGVSSLPIVPGRPYLYLDGLQDPGNLGALAGWPRRRVPWASPSPLAASIRTTRGLCEPRRAASCVSRSQ